MRFNESQQGWKEAARIGWERNKIDHELKEREVSAMTLRISALTLLVVFAGVAESEAVLYNVDLSPAAGDALNLGSVVYPGDGAPGLSPANEPSLANPDTATGSGGEIGAGITYDDASMQLTLNVGYGDAFGFTDLGSDLNTGAAGGIHIHGPADPGSNAGIVFNLSTLGLHTPSGSRAGSAQGNIPFSASDQETLFDNRYYLNIHSVDNGGGEIRGQLVITGIIPEPASCLLLLLGSVAGFAFVGRWR